MKHALQKIVGFWGVVIVERNSLLHPKSDFNTHKSADQRTIPTPPRYKKQIIISKQERHSDQFWLRREPSLEKYLSRKG